VVGYKPSAGRVTRAGVKSVSESLDVVGGFARSVRGAALLAAVLTGDERLLPTDHDIEAPRMGLAPTPEWSEAGPATQAAWSRAVDSLAPLAICSDVALPPSFARLVALQKSVMAFEGARALAFEHLFHRAALSAPLVSLLDTGAAITGADHATNLALAHACGAQVDALFDHHDVLLAPSTLGEAPEGLADTGDPLFCRAWSLLGLPCVHLPFATGENGLPVGLQLVGRRGDDHRLLAVAHWVHERLTR
jgi:Asp-tRNA(Asn)/Glu-tRNA(Gln) amidotransferase A subunit family amidase